MSRTGSDFEVAVREFVEEIVDDKTKDLLGDEFDYLFDKAVDDSMKLDDMIERKVREAVCDTDLEERITKEVEKQIKFLIAEFSAFLVRKD